MENDKSCLLLEGDKKTKNINNNVIGLTQNMDQSLGKLFFKR